MIVARVHEQNFNFISLNISCNQARKDDVIHTDPDEMDEKTVLYDVSQTVTVDTLT